MVGEHFASNKSTRFLPYTNDGRAYVRRKNICRGDFNKKVANMEGRASWFGLFFVGYR